MTKCYDGPVIDPHHHLWDLSLQRHPWLEKARASGEEMVVGNLGPILRDYGIDDYRADAARQNVIATVHDLECLEQSEEELRFAEDGMVISHRLHCDSQAGDCLIQVAEPISA